VTSTETLTWLKSYSDLEALIVPTQALVVFGVSFVTSQLNMQDENAVGVTVKVLALVADGDHAAQLLEVTFVVGVHALQESLKLICSDVPGATPKLVTLRYALLKVTPVDSVMDDVLVDRKSPVLFT
jgi:hypothetical protein